ncbi:MAG: BlaI/MecI/CopY family transcriptional regulator [Lachnospiraceae bacterium]|nr:BlaI/MecI/CopY family transcriptional regulator [Lachnospiraceae bacterium]
MAKFKINNIGLTKRDLDVMTILWGSEEPETASMIVRNNPNLTMNTVQAVLRKLLKDNFIKVADIVYSGTVLTRSYKPMVSQEDFWLQKIISDYNEIRQKVSKADVVDALLRIDKNAGNITDDIRQIKEVLDNYTGK